MEICQLKIAGFYIPAIKPHILKNVFDKNKLKYEISTSGKSINIFEQTLISDENSIYNIIRNIMRTSPELKLCIELGKLTLKLSEYYRLVIDHDITLDLFDDFETDEDLNELKEFLTKHHICHKIDENRMFTILGQKCDLDFEYINKLIFYIMYGAKEECGIDSYECGRYAIYHKSKMK